jgi:hypothetical protein
VDEYSSESADDRAEEEFSSEELPPTDDVEVELDDDDFDLEDEAEGVEGETSTGDFGASDQGEDMPEGEQQDG